MRNYIGNEYYTAKNELNEKKAKIINSPASQNAEYDSIMIKFTCIDKDSELYQANSHKFMLPEVGKFEIIGDKSGAKTGGLFCLREQLDIRTNSQVQLQKEQEKHRDSGVPRPLPKRDKLPAIIDSGSAICAHRRHQSKTRLPIKNSTSLLA